MIITPTGSLEKRTFVGTPAQSVLLSKLPVSINKQFASAVTDAITVACPLGRTIVSLLNAHANMYPGSMSIVEEAGKYGVSFQATIFFTVEVDDGNIILLSSTIQVLGELGLISEIPTPPTVPTTAPVISCEDTGITAEGVSVYGKIRVGTFDCEIIQYTDINVVVDPDL